MAGGGNAHAAAGYFQLALDRNAMSRRGRNRQRARAVKDVYKRQGMDNGSTNCSRMVIQSAPSIRAASYNSPGIEVWK